jgi:hypothetical protein
MNSAVHWRDIDLHPLLGADEVSWDVTVAGDYHTYCGFRSLDTHVTVSCCTNTPPDFLFFQNLSMLRLDFLLSCLLICLPDQTFYNLYIIRSYFQFFSVLIKFVKYEEVLCTYGYIVLIWYAFASCHEGKCLILCDWHSKQIYYHTHSCCVYFLLTTDTNPYLQIVVM